MVLQAIFSPEQNMASTKTILSTAASVAASAMLIRTITQDFVPYQLRDYFFSGLHRVLSRFSSHLSITIEEFEGFSPNQIFKAAEIYLGTRFSSTARRLKACKPEKDKNITITMERDEEVSDVFEGIQLKWTLSYRETENRNFNSPNDFNSTLRSQTRYYLLSFHQKHKDKVLNAYLPHVLNRAKDMKEEKKGLKIHTLEYHNLYGNLAEVWSPVNLDHPATFQTLAMEPELKEALIADLDRFVERRDYYKKVGKAWKRGYLLYGPPGTGKSSMVAAMANYLHFSIYDLELSKIRCNSELRKLLVAAANRSILVVEDIDCTIDLKDREGNEGVGRSIQMQQYKPQVTLSGFLNFIDGLWSSCGDQRIIIFTTNHKEKLDPALLRPGRMDMHIHMSYCTAGGFKVLASNYLGLQHHHLFEEIEALIQEVEVTPAQVAEELMKHDDPTLVLEGLQKFLRKKKETKEESKNVEAKAHHEKELNAERVDMNRKEDMEETVVF